jgi:hypothetical protein
MHLHLKKSDKLINRKISPIKNRPERSRIYTFVIRYYYLCKGAVPS